MTVRKLKGFFIFIFEPMKKLIFILFLLPLLTFGQNRFPSIDSAKNYVLRYVKNSAVESFTNLRMQNVTYGTLQLIDSLCGSGVIDTIWKSGDTLKYRIGTQTVVVGVFSSGGSTPTLQQVTTQGNSTTDTVTVGGLQIPLLSSTAFFKSLPTSGPNNIILTGTMGRPTLSLGTTISNTAFVSPLFTLTNNSNGYNASIVGTVTNYNTITVPDSSGTLPLRVKLNSTTYSAANNGTIDLGTISVTPDSSIFATRFWVNSTFQPIGNYLTTGSSGSLQNLTITGTNGNGHIHLRHQASLPTATGQSTVIYANSNGDFAYKNDGNHHTTFVTSANTADRSYTFQNRNYTVADNAEVVKYTDTSAMLSPYQLTTVANVTYQLQLDTVPVASFGAGSGAAGDTAAFSTSAVYGSFYNDGSDTLIITQMRAGVLGTSPSITTEIYWNDSLNITAGATILVSGGTSVTGTIGATNVTSFTNNKIPPGNWVFCRTSAVATKPTYFTLTLLGYKKRK